MDEKKMKCKKKEYKRNQKISISNKEVITGAGCDFVPDTTKNLDKNI